GYEELSTCCVHDVEWFRFFRNHISTVGWISRIKKHDLSVRRTFICIQKKLRACIGNQAEGVITDLSNNWFERLISLCEVAIVERISFLALATFRHIQHSESLVLRRTHQMKTLRVAFVLIDQLVSRL